MFKTGCFEVPPVKRGNFKVPFTVNKSPTKTKSRQTQIHHLSQNFRSGDVCTYVRTYVRTYIHTYVRTYVCIYVPTYVHMYLRTYVRMYAHTYVRTYVRTYVHT